MNTADQDQVLFERRGVLGLITLNRPQALNALTAQMVEAMLVQLQEWADDPQIHQVLIQGAGDRGLCAGGDIVAMYRDITGEQIREGVPPGQATADFWRMEYRLNELIANYPKPYAALMDGVVLGGGIGISAHGSLRIVTERSRCGMPETMIGFVPDVGGTYLLSRSPGETGTHAALTGQQFDAADAIYLGLADYYVPAARLPELIETLTTHDAAEAVAAAAEVPEPSSLASRQQWIDRCYEGDSLLAVVGALREAAETDPEAGRALAAFESRSPIALAVTLASLRRAARLPGLREVLDQEYRVGIRMLAQPDMREGIRAQVIDKDRDPQWQPAELAGVSAETVGDFFTQQEEHRD
ncbi:enoyl-CoA hydratase/isomerase family protein [Acaricomes phytoseiuli]|uniref:enoyl-CoA hydratase/isomerase family protein n=1 Tax=Acaricomes phytoseiuli TaxID=291968 RepID=UPI0003666ED6|nr:enoyl-CoA hydratase/isomerase family protein [Acaricomes phytoseiuli]MCW1248865.1 enoyl-CoA hydratase/isomerase family protein [Acaricomes phytoseiuli]